MATNKYGVVGTLGETILSKPISHNSAPVYIGIAPLHLASAPAQVNRPVLVTGYEDAVRLLGYSDDFDKYDLCEVVDAHFRNRIQPVGPIICINVFDPAATGALSETETSASVALSGGVGYIADLDCAISTIGIEGKTMGEDFRAALDADTGKIKITDLTGTLGSPVTVTYKKANLSGISALEIVGVATDDGVKTGVKAVGYVYQELGIAPSFLCAPKWGADAAVHAALVTASQAVSGRFFAMVPEDIPTTNRTATEAIAGKSAAKMGGEVDLPSWPKGGKDGKLYHLAVLYIVAAMQTDIKNGGIPYETPDNKEIDVDGAYLDAATPVMLDIDQADRLKAAGIRTILRWGGKWRLWGCHTGAYAQDGSSDQRSIFDSGMRMLYYVLNTFVQRYFDEISKPVSLNKLQSIVADVNAWLDGLATQGALLYAKAEPEIAASMGDLVMGRVRFKLRTTTTPPLSYIEGVLSYTDEGLVLMMGEG